MNNKEMKTFYNPPPIKDCVNLLGCFLLVFFLLYNICKNCDYIVYEIIISHALKWPVKNMSFIGSI